MINPFEYIKAIQDKWAWQSMCKSFWQKVHIIGDQKNQWVMTFNLSTGGLSDHERLIEDIDKLFWFSCWESSHKGGHHVFMVNPTQWGYKLVNDYARDNKVSRQSIYHYPDKFEWISVSDNVKFIKPVTTEALKTQEKG